MNHSVRALLLTAALPAAAAAQIPAGICAAAISTPAPAMVERVTCDQSAITRFFLLAPELSGLSADARAGVLSDPLRYALTFMMEDAVSRLKSGFADPATKSMDLIEILTSRDKSGAMVAHPLFEVRPARGDIAHVDWDKLPLDDLFKTVPTGLSPYLNARLQAEDTEKAK